MMASLRERLELSADPIAARRLLEQEQRRPRRGRRRIFARMVPPGSQSFADWLAQRGYTNPDVQIDGSQR
jgi:hypothetical protein